jgi:formate-dependent nitrite reductase membrane component NrfD
MEIQKRFYEWMVKPTPQRQWIEGRGVLLWLAMFFGFGAGLYLVSLYQESRWGMFIGWLIVIFGFGGFHLLYLGKPLRAWRAFSRPQTSWISRGFMASVLFVVTGGIQMALSRWVPSADVTVLKVLAASFAFIVSIYTGFVMSYVRALPFWNNALLPVWVIVSELLGGASATMVIGLSLDTTINIEMVEWLVRILLVASAIILGIYLWVTTYAMKGGKEGVMALLKGPAAFSLPFWLGLVLLGTAIPLMLAWYSYLLEQLSPLLLITGTLCEFIGGLATRYSILRAGIYAPLLPIQ